jgi:hypothetical protein
MWLLFCFVLQEDKDSSSSSEDDDDVGGSVEGVPIAVDETIVFEVAAVEATATAEPANSVIAATKSASGTADVSDVPEEGVDAAEVAVEGTAEAPEGAVSASIVDDVGLTQGGSSRSSDRVDSTLLDSTPPSKFYVRRSRRVNIVSSDSERTLSVGAVHLTPRASQSESTGASSMHVIPTLPSVVVDASLGVPSAANTQGDEEDVVTLDHIPDIDAGTATEGVTAAGIIPAVEVPDFEHIGSEVEVIPSTEIEDDIPDIEGTFAQDPNDNAPLEDMDMADVHDSYDAVLADVQEENAQAAVPELEVTSPAIKNASPTKTGKLVSCYPLLFLLYVFGSGCIYNSASWL